MKTIISSKNKYMHAINRIPSIGWLFLSLMLVIGMTITGCEGPAGSEGPGGPEGPAGPIGPAGEDGSMIYAGNETPSDNIGDLGDYYLNSNTGEFYGPKDSEGWGEPIIVLMGDDGQDGTDGADGEDGSQIYSGSGAPDATLGVEGDYYLDKTSYELYGPKTSSGWGTPLNLKGADGNANVTRYIFPGHDFSSENSTQKLISDVGNADESIWLVYLGTGVFKYPVPGYGPGSSTEYTQQHGTFDSGTAVDVRIRIVSGPGENFTNIYIVQIEASDTEDLTSGIGEDVFIPGHLDISSYEDVAEYYGFRN